MHRKFNDLKTKTKEYKELVKHHTQLIKDQNENKWEVVETSDLEEICEAYHQAKLKLLGIGNVSQQSELLKGFLEKVNRDIEYGGDLTWQTRDEAKELLKLFN